MVVGRANSADDINVDSDDEQEGSIMMPPYYNGANTNDLINHKSDVKQQSEDGDNDSESLVQDDNSVEDNCDNRNCKDKQVYFFFCFVVVVVF